MRQVRGPGAGLKVQVCIIAARGVIMGARSQGRVSGTPSLRILGGHPGQVACRLAEGSFLRQGPVRDISKDWGPLVGSPQDLGGSESRLQPQSRVDGGERQSESCVSRDFVRTHSR